LVTAPKNAYEAWLKYKGQVQLVQRLYSNNFQDGFETDRGRVYLQFGSPSSLIVRETSASEYPYEIWQYDKIGIYSKKHILK
jgi:GWxTD domain-containing protein